MTKATIITNHGEAEYTVQLELNTAAAEARSDELADKIIEYTGLIATATTEWLDAEDAVKAKLGELDAALLADADEETIDALVVEALRLRITADEKKRIYDRLVATKLSLSSQKTNLDNRLAAATQPQVRIWCADYTENLAGTVSVIVVPAENTGADLVIRPGFSDGAAWDGAVHGHLTPAWSQSAAQAYYNYAILPGVQKWLPTYRYGTISNLSGNTCDVALEASISSAQDLDVNKETTLTGVTIEYMDCHGSAFQNGDRVVVRFDGKDKTTPTQNWDNPKVIGFVTNPRICDEDLFFIVQTGTGVSSENAAGIVRISTLQDDLDNNTDVKKVINSIPTPINGNGDGANFANIGKRGKRYAYYVTFDEVAPAGPTTTVRIWQWDTVTTVPGDETIELFSLSIDTTSIATSDIFVDANSDHVFVTFGRVGFPNKAFVRKYDYQGNQLQEISLSGRTPEVESIRDIQCNDDFVIVLSDDDSYGQGVYTIAIDAALSDVDINFNGESALLSASDDMDNRIVALTSAIGGDGPEADIFVYSDNGVLRNKTHIDPTSYRYTQICANRTHLGCSYSSGSVTGPHHIDIYARSGAYGENLSFVKTIDL